MMDAQEAVSRACAEVGIHSPSSLRSGSWIKTDTLSGRNGKGDGRVIVDDLRATAWNWQTGEKATVRLDVNAPIDRKKFAERMERDRRQQDQKHRKAAEKAMRLVSAASLGTHPYFALKGFPTERALVVSASTAAAIGGDNLVPDGATRAIVIPARIRDRLTSCQLIWDDGTKRFLFGGEMGGACVRMAQGRDTWLCEGYATGLSLRAALQAMSRRDTILCCFSAHNVAEVARGVQGRAYVAADRDKPLPHYDGLGTGEHYARQTRFPYAIPGEIGQDFERCPCRAGDLCRPAPPQGGVAGRPRMTGLRGDDGWRRHLPKGETVSHMTKAIDPRPMSEWSHVERDAAGHNSTAIRDAEWWSRRRSRWTWYRQRRADIMAVVAARIAPDVTIPETDDAETLLRVVAYHLQAANGGDRLVDALDAFCVEWAPWARIGASDILDAILADVSGRSRDLSAVRVGVELRVTWEERCRLGLRTIRPSDMTPAEFCQAANARKREGDRKRAEEARRRCGVASWEERTWKARERPWIALGISRATYFRRQKAEADAGAATPVKTGPKQRETLASQIGGASINRDARVSRVASLADGARRDLVRAAPGLSPISSDLSSNHDNYSRNACEDASARMEGAALDDTWAPRGNATRQSQPARDAA